MSFTTIKKTFEFAKTNPEILLYGLLLGAVNLVMSGIFGAGLGAAGIAAMASDPSFFSNPAALGAAIAAIMSAVLILVAVQFVVSSYFTAASYRFVKTKDLHASFGDAVKLLPNMLIAQILKALVMFAVIAAGGILFVVGLIASSAFGSNAAGNVISLIFMVVAGLVLVLLLVWISVRLTFVDLMVCIGKKGPVDAIKRSMDETKGKLVSIFGTTLMYGIIIFVVLLPFQIAAFFLGSVGSIAYSLLSSLFSPLINVLFVILYFEVSDKRAPQHTSGSMGQQQASPSSDDGGLYVPPNAGHR